MNSPHSIPDVFLLDLMRVNDRLIVLRDEDLLLRRFGQVEIRKLVSGEITPFTFREVADEVWSVIKGKATLVLIDRRGGSPSKNQVMEVHLLGERPQAVLVPFGVAYAITALKNVHLVRITTHPDGIHPGDETFPRKEFSKLLSAR